MWNTSSFTPGKVNFGLSCSSDRRRGAEFTMLSDWTQRQLDTAYRLLAVGAPGWKSRQQSFIRSGGGVYGERPVSRIAMVARLRRLESRCALHHYIALLFGTLGIPDSLRLGPALA